MTHSLDHSMVFKKTSEWNFAETTVTYRFLKVLARIDGKATVGDIQEQLSLSDEEVCAEIEKFKSLHLITAAVATDTTNEEGALSVADDFITPSSTEYVVEVG